MNLPIYQVDAFSDRVFKGNPAAVCPLERWPDEATMQAIAAENNLAETAFFVPREGGYDLRWFTPVAEIDLCGHATLASAHVVFNRLKSASGSVTFHSKSGPLTVTEDGEWLTMDFPSRPASRCDPPAGLTDALSAAPSESWKSRDLMAVFASEQDVRAIVPRFDLILALGVHGVIVTAPGDDCDFVSRFFAPKMGVPEDPVTGSAHCTLIPYWAARLGKTTLRARQVSKRGGEVRCELKGDRVAIAGRVALYLEGTIEV